MRQLLLLGVLLFSSGCTVYMGDQVARSPQGSRPVHVAIASQQRPRTQGIPSAPSAPNARPAHVQVLAPAQARLSPANTAVRRPSAAELGAQRKPLNYAVATQRTRAKVPLKHPTTPAPVSSADRRLSKWELMRDTTPPTASPGRGGQRD